MKTYNYWLKLFTVFIFTFLFSHLYAVQINLDGTIEKINGDGNLSTCHKDDEFILKNTTTYDGIPFDLKLKITAEDNEADTLKFSNKNGFRKRPCIGITNNNIEIILRDIKGGDDNNTVASMDIELSTVRDNNQSPLTVNSLQFTALDLDINTEVGELRTGTDDIYMSHPSRAFKDANQSKVTIDSNGSFGNGFDIKITGRSDDKCTNSDPACKVTGIIELDNPGETLKVRVQNDNAYGNIEPNNKEKFYDNAYRRMVLSFTDIVGLGIDHGDAPYDDAYNDIRNTVILGQSVADGEVFVSSENADSDDADVNATTFDDEDAVTIVGQDINSTFMVAPGHSYDFNVTTTGSGYLSAWIDYNNNGSFDAGEKVIDDKHLEDANLTTLNTIVPITIATDASSGKSYVRFRFSQNQGVGATGNGGIGEVEDYVIMISNGPTAGNDSIITEVGDRAVINILNNDNDIENDLNASTVDLIAPSGVDGKDTDGDGDIDLIVVPNEGKWSVDDAGVVTFIPDNGFTADPTPIKYTVQDAGGTTSNTADINVNVLQQLHDDSIGVYVGLNADKYPTVTMNILKNDDTVVANTISLEGPTDSTPDDRNGDGYTDEIRVPGEGIWTVDSNGTVTFVPETTFKGDPTPITYTAQDNTGHTLKPATITIVYSTHTHTENNNTQVVNNPYPVYINTGGGGTSRGGTAKPKTEPLTEGDEGLQAIDDNASFCEGTSLVFNAAANDIYANGTFNLIDPETGAAMTAGQTLRLEYGSVTMNKEGVFTYTPFPETLTIDAVMEEHFTYKLTSVTGAHDTAKVYICIACCPESSDSVDALSNIGLVTLLFMFGSLGLYFIRKEEEANI